MFDRSLLETLTAFVAVVFSSATACHADLLYNETFTVGALNFGTDTEGLIGSTFSIDITIPSGTYQPIAAAGGLPGAPFSSASVTISGSSVAMNNGTFSSPTGGFLIPAFGVSSLVTNTNAFPLLFTLPSGSSISDPQHSFAASASAGTITAGSPILVTDFTSGSPTNSSGVNLLPAGGDVFSFSASVPTSTRTISLAVPEPSSLSLIGGMGLVWGARRRR